MLSNRDRFTIEVIASISDAESDQISIQQFTGYTDRVKFYWYPTTSGTISVIISFSGSSHQGYAQNISLESGKYYSFILVYDGREVVPGDRYKIYKDGQPISLTISGTPPENTDAVSPNPVTIGLSNEQYFAATYSKVCIWSEPFTADDVAYAYANPEKLVTERPGTSILPGHLVSRPHLGGPSVGDYLPDLGSRSRYVDIDIDPWDTSGWAERGGNEVITDQTEASVLSPGNYLSKFENIADSSDVWEVATLASANRPYDPEFYFKKISYSGSGILIVSNPYGDPKGQWSVDLSVLGEDEVLLTSEHEAVTVDIPFKSNDGSPGIGIQFKTSSVNNISNFYAGGFKILDKQPLPSWENVSGGGTPVPKISSAVGPVQQWCLTDRSDYHVFDGVDDYVDCGDVGDHTDDFTLVWYGVPGVADTGTLIGRRSGSSSQYQFYPHNDGTLKLFADIVYTSTGVLSGGVDLCGVTIDGIASEFYINAVAAGTISPTVGSVADNFLIGAYKQAAPTAFLKSLPIFTAVFDSPFDQDDWDELYNNGSPILPSQHSKWNSNCLEVINNGAGWTAQGETTSVTVEGSPVTTSIPRSA
jgi:hypothetical protein